MFKNGCFLLAIHFYYYVRHVSYLHRQNKSNSHVLHRYNRINRSYSSIFLSKILDEELRLENEGKQLILPIYPWHYFCYCWHYLDIRRHQDTCLDGWTRKEANQTVRLFDFNTKITVFTMKHDQDSFDWRQSYDFFLTLSIIIK